MSLEACADIVARGDPLRFRAALAAPVERRGALMALYAFNVEISRAPWLTQEPMVAEMRLQFWRDAVEALGAGGAGPGHEVVAPLGAAMRDHALPPATLEAMAAARRWDAWREPHADMAALERYLADTAGALMALSGRILGAGREGEAMLQDAGLATGAGLWLLAAPALRAAGAEPLPEGAGMREVAALGLRALARARDRRKALPRAARAALVPLAGLPAVLVRARAAPWEAEAGTLTPAEIRLRAGALWIMATGRF